MGLKIRMLFTANMYLVWDQGARQVSLAGVSYYRSRHSSVSISINQHGFCLLCFGQGLVTFNYKQPLFHFKSRGQGGDIENNFLPTHNFAHPYFICLHHVIRTKYCLFFSVSDHHVLYDAKMLATTSLHNLEF